MKESCKKIDEKEIPNVIRRLMPNHKDDERHNFSMMFIPRDDHLMRPQNLKELLTALLDVIKFLKAFHEEG